MCKEDGNYQKFQIIKNIFTRRWTDSIKNINFSQGIKKYLQKNKKDNFGFNFLKSNIPLRGNYTKKIKMYQQI